MLCVLNEAILMSTLNINHCVENRKDFPKLSLFASWTGAIINPQWLGLPMSRTNFHGPKDVRAIEVRVYMTKDLHLTVEDMETEVSRYPFPPHSSPSHPKKHYKNTPIQIYRKFHLQKLKIFR